MKRITNLNSEDVLLIIFALSVAVLVVITIASAVRKSKKDDKYDRKPKVLDPGIEGGTDEFIAEK